MNHELLALLWQLPAIFTAVPLVHRLLPFKLAARAIPLFYSVVSLLVMLLPGRVCLALAAAGLVTILHSKVGLSLSAEEPPDMQAVTARLRTAYDTISGLLVLGYERLFLAAAGIPQVPIVDDKPGDDNLEHDEHPDPPRPPQARITQRIPHI